MSRYRACEVCERKMNVSMKSKRRYCDKICEYIAGLNKYANLSQAEILVLVADIKGAIRGVIMNHIRYKS